MVDCCESVNKIYAKLYVNIEIKMKKAKINYSGENPWYLALKHVVYK